MTPALEIRNLTRTFGDLVAVRELSLSVAPGEIFGLVGPDGAGKTTTLRIACGLMHATSGEVRVAGCDVLRGADSVKDQIGYMAQKFGLYGDLTVEENLAFYADLFGISCRERDERASSLLRMTRMEPFRTRLAAALSGGMKQKLALMCSLLHRPRILFLDEPTNGVDPVSRRDFWAILVQLVNDGMTVIVTTAYLDEAERCHRVGLMDQGALLALDTPSALKASIPEICLEVRGGVGLRQWRDLLRSQPGIVDVELAGSALHLFLSPQADPDAIPQLLPGASIRRITPSLEDVLLATLRRQGRTHAAA